MYSFAHLIEFQQEKEEQIVSEPSFSPFQIISREKNLLGENFFWVKIFGVKIFGMKFFGDLGLLE